MLNKRIMMMLLLLFAVPLVCMADNDGPSGVVERNEPEGPRPPEKEKKYKCGDETVENGCVHSMLSLGATSLEHEHFDVNVLLYAQEMSPALYTPRVLYVETPYYFRHLSNGRHQDGVTPSGYTFGRQGDEKVVFEFAEGESVVKARPGENSNVSATLRLFAADGHTPTSSDPYFADLETSGGEVWRFAVKTTEGHVLGEFIYWKTSRGVKLCKSALGLDVVYDDECRVRQILTPSRLAVVETLDDGFSVTAYPVEDVPEFDDSTGLYVIPAGVEPTRTMTVSHDGDVRNHRRARVTIQRGTGTPLAYIYDRTDRDWEMTKPDGTRTRRETTFNADGSSRVMVAEYAADGRTRLKRTVWHYDKNPWGYSLRLKEEGWGDCMRTNAYTYVTASGAARGKKASHMSQSGLREEYAYDGEGRLLSVTAQKSDGTGDVKVTAYSYVSNTVYDVVSPGDTRPRRETVSWNGIETERTFYVYSAATQIVERAAAGSAFGAPGNRRTTQIYNSEGRIVKSIAPDGVETSYTYSTDPVTGVFTTTATTADRRTVTEAAPNGYVLETRTETFADGGQGWLTISRQAYTRNAEGKAIRTEDLAGRVTTAVWDCCNKVSETAPDGTTTLYTYDINRREIARGVLTATGLTNETYVTRRTEYDSMGRVAATWTTNETESVGLPRRTYGYDWLGRRVRTTDERGNDTLVAYSADGLTATTTYPTGLTSVRTTDVFGRTVSTTGTASAAEFYSYAVASDGLQATEIRYGAPDGARFVRSVRDSLGDAIAEERPAFGGGVLATTNEYDLAGRVIHTLTTSSPQIAYAYDIHGSVTNTIQSADGTWRASGSRTTYARLAEAAGGIPAGAVVRIDERTASCSDASIAPISQRTLTQLDGFAQGEVSRSVAFDVRGNATERVSTFDSETGVVTTETIRPEASNHALDLSRFGASLMTVSLSSVTNSVANDALGRPIATTDGRGNTTTVAYNALGERESVTDAAGNTTCYAYDTFGRNVAVTNALGVATVYEFDARGNKTYEGGGTYPVSYAYDAYNVMTNMTTYRAEGSLDGDTTSWEYDEATGLLVAKTYADGKGPEYTYTPNGSLATRTWARGVVTTYSYDGWNSLTNTAYSDGTPSISLAYDAMGRQVSATDAAGTTVTAYNDYGEVVSEATTGLYGKTLAHHRDGYGRDLGYTIDNSRKSIIEYEADTARMKRVMMAGAWFTYHYLPGTDLKSRLQYGGSGSAYYTYEQNRDLLTQVRNHINGGVISQYDYVNDAAGRRTAITRSGSMMSETRTDYYGYNDRSELVSGTKDTAATNLTEYAYQYDDIGNRLSSLDLGTNRTYTANSLNQYTNIVEGAGGFLPQFDDDGNQTLIKTATGVWQVTYNGENRPVSWTCGTTNIVMKFDLMGRRVEYVETVSGVTNTHHRFVYDGYLCIQRLNAASNNAIDLVFGWDPSEPVATRPLILQKYGQYNLFYTHDGNKNVSELVFFQQANGIAAHYEYAPFGAVTATSRSTPVTAYDFREYNPFRFSAEYSDDKLYLIYFNTRHYLPINGRWLLCDPMGGRNLYAYLSNYCFIYDVLGLASSRWGGTPSSMPDFEWNIVNYIESFPTLKLDQEPYASILKDDLLRYGEYVRMLRGISNEEYLKHCPCDINDAHVEDGWTVPSKSGHEGGDMEVRREFPDGATTFGRKQGQQCVYDKCGKLINKGKAAGTPDDFSHRAEDGFKENVLHGLSDAKAYVVGRILDFLPSILGYNPDLATTLDHLFNPPDIGMDIDGSPCPENDGGVK